MTRTKTPARQASALSRPEAADLAAEENDRFLALVRALGPDDWRRPTDCPAWNVRQVTAHVLGMMELAASPGEFVRVCRAGARAAGDRPVIDGMTEVQVAERDHLTPAQLLGRLAEAAPRSARARRRLPAPLRTVPTRQQVAGVPETWRLGYLFDVVLTRDVWMHRVDLARATGREPVLTPAHDGRLVADIVAEWAGRHGQPFHLALTGNAGGPYGAGRGGEEITADAVDFCRALSGRVPGEGLLSHQVPF